MATLLCHGACSGVAVVCGHRWTLRATFAEGAGLAQACSQQSLGMVDVGLASSRFCAAAIDRGRALPRRHRGLRRHDRQALSVDGAVAIGLESQVLTNGCAASLIPVPDRSPPAPDPTFDVCGRAADPIFERPPERHGLRFAMHTVDARTPDKEPHRRWHRLSTNQTSTG